MDFEIKEKKDNNLLERTEVDALLSFEGPTPPVPEMRQTVVQKLGCNPDLMVIRKVEPGFGEQSVKLRVHIYKSPAQLKKIEEKFVLKRNKLGEEKKEEPPKEEKTEEKPAEEKKEEKAEEKKEE
ncbi:hypothetical protein GF412_00555 [Candidatus Micrarchaeota archaeon]|nr:hypothetical protein [Candidatus Micrarchaeota archaeon]MBD3417466.1 hypothetical protein [Candidatus Micrarchaeota archaeon]